MRTLLLTSIAALSVLAAPAVQAQTPTDELPDAFFGFWCYAKDISTKTEKHYLQPFDDGRNDCEGDEKIGIWDDLGGTAFTFDWSALYSDGTGDHWDGRCVFENIEIKTSSLVVVQATCAGGFNWRPHVLTIDVTTIPGSTI